MPTNEIVLPETKPETEWVRGRAVRKVSPTYDHARVQGTLMIVLGAWARGRGTVATEWRFRVAPPGKVRRPLVPDLAFVSLEALRGRTHDEIQTPAFPPTVAIEILSRGDKPRDVASKIATYLAAGTSLVIVFDPRKRTATLNDAAGALTLAPSARIEHPALPGFTLALEPFFAEALDLPH